MQPVIQKVKAGEIFPLNVTIDPPRGDLTPVMVRVAVKPQPGLQVLGGETRYITELYKSKTVTLYLKAARKGTYTVQPEVAYMLLYQNQYGGNLKTKANQVEIHVEGQATERNIEVKKEVETIAGIPVTMVGVPVKVRITVMNQEHETLKLLIVDPLPAGFKPTKTEVEVKGETITFKVTVNPGDTAIIEYEAVGLIPGDYIFPGSAVYHNGNPIAIGNHIGITVSEKPLIIRRELDSTMISRGGIITIKIYVAYLGIPSMTGELPTINMLFITIGLPPGFTLNVTSLREAVESSPYVERYEIHSPTRIDLLTGTIKPGTTFTLQFTIQAKYPLEATVPPAKVQDYYNPEYQHQTTPESITVTPNKSG